MLGNIKKHVVIEGENDSYEKSTLTTSTGRGSKIQITWSVFNIKNGRRK